jgi:putative hemolysin
MAPTPRSLHELWGFSVEESRYRVEVARSTQEIEAALRLRFEVFNLELGEGLDASAATGMDRDQFDAQCVHLLLKDRDSGEVVGTYRLQDQEMAASGAGWYCDQEYVLEQLPAEVRAQSIELGRACIHRDHRHSKALFALWRGIYGLLFASGRRYLFGCCSLTSRDPRDGLICATWLERRGFMHPQYRLSARPDYLCTGAPAAAAEVERFSLPQLFGSYLRYGVQAASEPALDRAFGTVDFLVLFDQRRIDPKLSKLLL